MSDPTEESELKNIIQKLENQMKELESGLSLKNDVEENEKLYQYLLKQKKYERIEQRAKEKLADIAKIRECEFMIQKAEKKLAEIEKIKELKIQINNVSENI